MGYGLEGYFRVDYLAFQHQEFIGHDEFGMRGHDRWNTQFLGITLRLSVI